MRIDIALALLCLIRRRIWHIILVGVPSAVAVGMALYYLLMPAWILILRYDYDESLLPQIENRIEIQESGLAEFPTLKQAIMQANRDYPFGHTPSIGASHLEGKRIVEEFQMSQAYSPEYRVILIDRADRNGSSNDVKAYFVQIVFDYDRPLIQ